MLDRRERGTRVPVLVDGGGRRCSHGGKGSGANFAVPVNETPYV